MKPRQPVVVEATRGPMIENRHQVIYVVVDAKNHVVDFHGNTDYVVTPRSSVKWLQAVPFVESGAVEKFALSEPHIALACASHKAQDHHLSALRSWLEKIKLTESVLECGPALPTNTPLSHNCSGKHLGFVSTALVLGHDPKNYTDLYHPIQELQKKWMSEVFGLDFFKLPHGGDGCGIPTFAVPLQKLAQAMNIFVQSGTFLSHRKTLNRILKAVQNHPDYVSASDDMASSVARVTQGNCLIKTGADGVYTGLIASHGYSFAMKAIDGNAKATELVTMNLLKKWGGLKDDELDKLKVYSEPAILDSRGNKVGTLRLEPGSF